MNTITQEDSNTKGSNIVHLNRNLTFENLQNIESAIDQIKQTKKEYCDESLDYIVEHLFNLISSLGFFADNNRINPKELILIEQLIQSALYRYYGLEHEFNALADNVITIEEEGDDVGIVEDEGARDSL